MPAGPHVRPGITILTTNPTPIYTQASPSTHLALSAIEPQLLRAAERPRQRRLRAGGGGFPQARERHQLPARPRRHRDVARGTAAGKGHGKPGAPGSPAGAGRAAAEGCEGRSEGRPRGGRRRRPAEAARSTQHAPRRRASGPFPRIQFKGGGGEKRQAAKRTDQPNSSRTIRASRGGGPRAGQWGGAAPSSEPMGEWGRRARRGRRVRLVRSAEESGAEET